jgi:hypothetical protein
MYTGITIKNKQEGKSVVLVRVCCINTYNFSNVGLLQEFVRLMDNPLYLSCFLRELRDITWNPPKNEERDPHDSLEDANEQGYPEAVRTQGVFTLLTMLFGRQWYKANFKESSKRGFCPRAACANVLPIPENHPAKLRIHSLYDYKAGFDEMTMPLEWSFDIDLTEKTVLMLKRQPHATTFAQHTPLLLSFEHFVDVSISSLQMALSIAHNVLRCGGPTEELVRQCTVMQSVHQYQEQPPTYKKRFPEGAGKHYMQDNLEELQKVLKKPKK